jgi:hypothetical protein
VLCCVGVVAWLCYRGQSEARRARLFPTPPHSGNQLSQHVGFRHGHLPLRVLEAMTRAKKKAKTQDTEQVLLAEQRHLYALRQWFNEARNNDADVRKKSIVRLQLQLKLRRHRQSCEPRQASLKHRYWPFRLRQDTQNPLHPFDQASSPTQGRQDMTRQRAVRVHLFESSLIQYPGTSATRGS